MFALVEAKSGCVVLTEKDLNNIQEAKFWKEEREVIVGREVIAGIIKEVTNAVTTTMQVKGWRHAIRMHLCEVIAASAGLTEEDLKKSDVLF